VSGRGRSAGPTGCKRWRANQGAERLPPIGIVRGRSNEVQMDILEDVKQIIAKQINVPVEQLNADTKLAELGVESLDVIEIVFALEEKFDISIPFNANDSAMEAFATIGQVANAVKGLVATKTS
jgi:acyl carrier protein